MEIRLVFEGKKYQADLSSGISLATPINGRASHPIAWWSPWITIDAIRAGDFVGDVKKGGAVNHKQIRIAPHGNGTHTECVGHIAKEDFFLKDSLKDFHVIADLTSIYPQKLDNGDRVIDRFHLEMLGEEHPGNALIIRTLPNPEDKLTRNYSGTLPPYFTPEAIHFIIEKGYRHLLTDLPSVDPENDGGKLAAHKTFWNYPGDQMRLNHTISEMVYVPDRCKDGRYLLNLQVLSIESDASPSQPVLYPLHESN